MDNYPCWRDWYPTAELRWTHPNEWDSVLQQLWKRNRVDYDGLRDIVLAVEEEWRDVPCG